MLMVVRSRLILIPILILVSRMGEYMGYCLKGGSAPFVFFYFVFIGYCYVDARVFEGIGIGCF